MMLDGEPKPTPQDIKLTEEIFNSLVRSTVDKPQSMSFETLSNLTTGYRLLSQARADMKIVDPLDLLSKDILGSILVTQAKELIENLDAFSDPSLFSILMVRNKVLGTISPDNQKLVRQAADATLK